MPSARWNGATFPIGTSPTYRAEWASGYRFSIALSEIGTPQKLTVVAKTLYAPAGTSFPTDLALGFYNVVSGRAEDPFTDVQVPDAPTSLRATRALRAGVRATWDPMDAERYDVWRARTAQAPGKRRSWRSMVERYTLPRVYAVSTERGLRSIPAVW